MSDPNKKYGGRPERVEELKAEFPNHAEYVLDKLLEAQEILEKLQSEETGVEDLSTEHARLEKQLVELESQKENVSLGLIIKIRTLRKKADDLFEQIQQLGVQTEDAVATQRKEKKTSGIERERKPRSGASSREKRIAERKAVTAAFKAEKLDRMQVKDAPASKVDPIEAKPIVVLETSRTSDKDIDPEMDYSSVVYKRKFNPGNLVSVKRKSRESMPERIEDGWEVAPDELQRPEKKDHIVVLKRGKNGEDDLIKTVAISDLSELNLTESKAKQRTVIVDALIAHEFAKSVKLDEEGNVHVLVDGKSPTIERFIKQIRTRNILPEEYQRENITVDEFIERLVEFTKIKKEELQKNATLKKHLDEIVSFVEDPEPTSSAFDTAVSDMEHLFENRVLVEKKVCYIQSEDGKSKVRLGDFFQYEIRSMRVDTMDSYLKDQGITTPRELERLFLIVIRNIVSRNRLKVDWVQSLETRPIHGDSTEKELLKSETDPEVKGEKIMKFLQEQDLLPGGKKIKEGKKMYTVLDPKLVEGGSSEVPLVKFLDQFAMLYQKEIAPLRKEQITSKDIIWRFLHQATFGWDMDKLERSLEESTYFSVLTGRESSSEERRSIGRTREQDKLEAKSREDYKFAEKSINPGQIFFGIIGSFDPKKPRPITGYFRIEDLKIQSPKKDDPRSSVWLVIKSETGEVQEKDLLWWNENKRNLSLVFASENGDQFAFAGEKRIIGEKFSYTIESSDRKRTVHTMSIVEYFQDAAGNFSIYAETEDGIHRTFTETEFSILVSEKLISENMDSIIKAREQKLKKGEERRRSLDILEQERIARDQNLKGTVDAQKGVQPELGEKTGQKEIDAFVDRISSSDSRDKTPKPREYTDFALDPKPGDQFRVPNFKKPGFEVITLADPNTLEGEILDNHLYTVRGVMYHRDDWNCRVADGRITKIEPSVLQSPDVQSQLRQQAPRSDRPVPPPIPPESPRERPTAHRTVEPPPIQTTETPSQPDQEIEQANSGEHTSPEAGMEYIFEFLGKEKLADLHQRFALAAFEQFNNTEVLMQTVENEMKFLFATLDQQQKDALEPKLREYNFSSFDAFDTHWQKEGWKILRNIIDRMVAQDLQGFIESDTELHKLMFEQDSPAGAKKAPDTHGGHGAHDSHDTHGSHAAPAQQPKTKEGWIARAWNRTKAATTGILTGAATSGIIASLNTWANTSISARATAGTVGIFATIGQRIFDRSQYEKKLHARDALRADVSARIKGKFLEKQKNIGGERMLSVLDAVLHKGVNVGSESAVHQASLDTDIKHKQDEVLRLLTSASGQGITAEQKAHYLAEAKEIEERLTELRLDRALFIHDQNNPATAYTQTVRDVTNTSSFFSMAWQRATRDVSGDNHGMFGSKADFWKGTVAAALVNGAVGFTLASFLPRTGILDIQSDMARAGTRFGIIGGIKGTQAALLERGKFEAAQRKLLKEARILLEHGEIEKAQRLIVDAQKITTWGDRALAGVKTGLIAGTVGAGVGAGVDVLRNTFFPQDFDSDKNTKVQQYQDVPGPQEKDFPAKPDRGGIKIAPESRRPDSIANDLKLRTFEVNKGDGLLTSANHFQKHPTVGPRLLESLKQNHQDWLSSATNKAKAMGLSGERLNDFVDKSVLHRWRVEEVERFGVRIPKNGGGWIYTKTLQPGAQIELVFKSDGPHLQIADKNFVTEHAPRVLGGVQDTAPKYTVESRQVQIPGDVNPNQLQNVDQFIITREDGQQQVAIARDVHLGKNGMATVTQLDGTVDKVNLNKAGFDSIVQPKERTIYPSLPLESRASSTNFGGNANSPAYIESLKERALKFRADSVQTDAVPARADKLFDDVAQVEKTFQGISDTARSPGQRVGLLRELVTDEPLRYGSLDFKRGVGNNISVDVGGKSVLVTSDNIDQVGELAELGKTPDLSARNATEIKLLKDELLGRGEPQPIDEASEVDPQIEAIRSEYGDAFAFIEQVARGQYTQALPGVDMTPALQREIESTIGKFGKDYTATQNVDVRARLQTQLNDQIAKWQRAGRG